MFRLKSVSGCHFEERPCMAECSIAEDDGRRHMAEGVGCMSEDNRRTAVGNMHRIAYWQVLAANKWQIIEERGAVAHEWRVLNHRPSPHPIERRQVLACSRMCSSKGRKVMCVLAFHSVKRGLRYRLNDVSLPAELGRCS